MREKLTEVLALAFYRYSFASWICCFLPWEIYQASVWLHIFVGKIIIPTLEFCCKDLLKQCN